MADMQGGEWALLAAVDVTDETCRSPDDDPVAALADLLRSLYTLQDPT